MGAMITRLAWFGGSFLLLSACYVDAQGISILELRNVQLVQAPAAVVHDPAGFPLAGVSVEEFSSDWKESLRSTKTDVAGAFSFSPVKGREIYDFQLRMDGFDPLRVRVRMDRKHGRELRLEMILSS